MNRLMMDKQAKWFFLIPLIFHPINAHVRYQVGYITFFTNSIIIHVDKIRVIIISLLRNNFPMIKARRQTYQMPLSDDSSLITRFSQQFRNRLLRPIKYTSRIIRKTVGMTMLTSQHTSTARAT